MKRFLKQLFRCRHHDWTGLMSYWMPTAINGFGMTVEEQCMECKEYRHIIDREWQNGRHPKSK